MIENLFDWNVNFSIGIAELDDHHRELVDLINVLARDHMANKGADVLDVTLNEIERLSRIHFAEEEALMRQAALDKGYLSEHAQDHQDFFARLRAIRHEHSPPDEVFDELLIFLVRWWAWHMLHVDMIMARRIRQSSQLLDLTEMLSDQDATRAVQALWGAIDGLLKYLVRHKREMERASRTGTEARD